MSGGDMGRPVLSLDEAHGIVAKGRAYTVEHFGFSRIGFVGHADANLFDHATDRLVAGVADLLQENERLRAICLAHDTDPEGCVECFRATIENRQPAPLPHGITPQPEHGDVLTRALRNAVDAGDPEAHSHHRPPGASAP